MTDYLFEKPKILSVKRAEPGAVRAGDEAIVLWDPELLRFLMSGVPAPGNPRVGAGIPGVGTHPMSGLPLGIMTEAALIAAGREETGIDILVYANINFKKPVPKDTKWEVNAQVESVKKSHVVIKAILYSPGGDNIYAEAELGVARVVDGKTTPILLSGKKLT